jgi:hypothetical protein
MKFVADAILFHASMLNDRRRTAGYLASIRDIVKPVMWLLILGREQEYWP